MGAHIAPVTAVQESPAEGVGRRGIFRSKGEEDERSWVQVATVLGGILAAVSPLVLLAAQLFGWAGDDDQARPGNGSIAMVAPSLDATKMTVAGTADPGVDAVLIKIETLGTDGRRWAEEADVFAREWKMVVPTEPKMVGEYQIKAWYHTPSDIELAVNQRELVSARMDPPPSPVVPSDLSECVAQYGDVCFEGQAGWSQPSIYRSEQ
jgi:hypothetical protein